MNLPKDLNLGSFSETFDSLQDCTAVDQIWYLLGGLLRSGSDSLAAYATEKLFAFSDDLLESFLPQLVGLLLAKELHSSFQHYLKRRARSSLYFAIQIHFILESQVQDNTELSTKAGHLLREFELASVTGKITQPLNQEQLFRLLVLSNQTQIGDLEVLLAYMAESMRSVTSGVPLKTQTWLMTVYEHVFTGTEAVNWVLERGLTSSRQNAVYCLKELLLRGIFYRVAGDQDFKDDASYYRFGSDTVPALTGRDYCFYYSELAFVQTLEHISKNLKAIESEYWDSESLKKRRLQDLRSFLQTYNRLFVVSLFQKLSIDRLMETEVSSDSLPLLHLPPWKGTLISIPYAEAFCLTTKDRVPFMFFFEMLSDSPEQHTHAPQPQAHHEQITIPLEEMSWDSDWLLMQEDNVQPLELAYGELWFTREERIRKKSPFGHHSNWSLQAAIVKTFDDLRQEQLCMQLITVFKAIFDEAQLPLWLRPYHIVATSSSGGLVEVVKDAISLDALKKKHPSATLLDYFKATYGPGTPTLAKAKRNFLHSLCAYSLICYFLQIKDRHNGNILIHTEAYVIHIDYGFLLGTSPGNMKFEDAPFKLTSEWLEVLDGSASDLFNEFITLFISGFLAVKTKYEQLLLVLESALPLGKRIPCLQDPARALAGLKERCVLGLSEKETVEHAIGLIQQSILSRSTLMYDSYQYYTRGIL